MPEKGELVTWSIVVVTLAALVFAGYAISVIKDVSEEKEPLVAKKGPVTRDMVIHEGKVGCDAIPDPEVRVGKDTVRFTNGMTTAATLEFDYNVNWKGNETKVVVVEPGENSQETVTITNAVTTSIPFDIVVGEEPKQCSPTVETNRPKIIIDPSG